MRQSTIALVCGMAGIVIGSLVSNVSSAAGTGYGEDRAQIEDLQRGQRPVAVQGRRQSGLVVIRLRA